MKTPAEVTYGLDARPPAAVIISTALQQATVVLVWILPTIVLARELGLSHADAAALISLCFIACGVGTMIQAVRRWDIGSGFLAPLSTSTPHIIPSLLAAKAGGLPLVAGMTVAAGLCTVLIARVLHRLRSLIPPEIAGAVVMIIGLAVCMVGAHILLETPQGGPPGREVLLVALVTLATAVGLSVWGKGVLRWACMLIAMAAGSVVALPLGVLEPSGPLGDGELPLLALPRPFLDGYAFDAALLPAFLVASLASALKTAGIVTSLQKLNDAAWVRPDPRSIAGGVTGDGLATMLGGLLGAPGANMSATNAAIQLATGVSSRVIAWATGGLCLAVACSPRAMAVLAQIPIPVVAATLLYSGALMLTSGMQLASARLLDARRSLAIGLAVAAALAVEVVPEAARWVPPGLQPLMTATAFGTLTALLLNAVLRLGVSRRVVLKVPGAEIPAGEVDDFVTTAGASWGARRDVIARLSHLVASCMDAIAVSGVAAGEVTLAITFDETRIEVRISYAGPALVLADRPPTAEEMLADDDAPARLAGYMVRRLSDRLRLRQRGETAELLLTLEH